MLRALGRWWPLFAVSLVSIFFLAEPALLRLRSIFASAPAHALRPANQPSTLSSSRSAMSTTTQVPSPDYLTVKAPGDRPTTATVIFIHGLGDSGDGWAPVARQLSRSSALSHIKWLLPNAPDAPVTANGGMRMPSWYDIYSFPKDNWFSPGRKEDKAGMLRSRDAIASLIQEQVAAGIPENRIVVGGFSQGAVVTMLVGFTAPPKLAGVAIASGYMPLWEDIKDLANGHAAELPIWWSHGTQDPLIPIQAAEGSLSIARAKLGISNAEPGSNVGIQYQTFPIPHSASEAEIVSLGQWLARVLPQSE